MKQKILSLSGIAIIFLTVASCKKDAPIYPDDPDFVPYTATAIGGAGTVDITLLGGNWQVTKTYEEYYNTSNVMQLSTESGANLYRGVEFNSASKGYLFDGSIDAPYPGVYTTSTAGTSVYIHLQADPFNRSANDKIQITNLTATSMTWVAIDPQVLITSGGSIKTGFRVVYTRKP